MRMFDDKGFLCVEKKYNHTNVRPVIPPFNRQDGTEHGRTTRTSNTQQIAGRKQGKWLQLKMCGR